MTGLNATSVRGRLAPGGSRTRARAWALLLFAVSACDFSGAVDERASRVGIVRPGEQAQVGSDVLLRITAEGPSLPGLGRTDKKKASDPGRGEALLRRGRAVTGAA